MEIDGAGLQTHIQRVDVEKATARDNDVEGFVAIGIILLLLTIMDFTSLRVLRWSGTHMLLRSLSCPLMHVGFCYIVRTDRFKRFSCL